MANKRLSTAMVFAGLTVFIALSVSAEQSYQGFHPAQRNKRMLDVPVTPQGALPFGPEHILDSPGRVVGTTYYDLQSNGSSGNRIALDFLGGVHYSWTGSAAPGLDPRRLYYGYIGASGDSMPGSPIDPATGAGFPQVGIINGAVDPLQRNSAVLGYHNSIPPDDRFAIESSQGSGIFSIDSTGFPSVPGDYAWPYFSIDRNDNIQAVATQSDVGPGQLRNHVYSRRPVGSSEWSPPMIFDASYNLSPIIVSSHMSSKSAIVWTRPIMQDSNQYDNDVAYIESVDGVTWNFSDIINITNYPPSAIGDTTLRAFTDIDALYDFDDNLHIIWNASHVTRDANNQMIVLYHASLYHWSAATGTNLIYDHPVRSWTADMGAWNLPISKMSIGVDADSNFLYVIFTRFDPSDYASFDTINGDPNPCGGDNAMPCANGELYLTYSRNGGQVWVDPLNLTNTPSPGCQAGNCDNDNWSSMAELVDNYLHIIYIDDKDAGGAALSEGNATQNPVIYLRYQNPTRTLGGNCDYLIGDINDSGGANGIDVVYGVNFLKGGVAPPYSCECAPHGMIFTAGDVNGSCSFNGLDITYMVNFFKGGSPLTPCPDCPPTR